MSRLFPILPAGLLIAGAACQPAAPAGLTEADRDAIAQVTVQFQDAVRAGDFPAVTALYTEDAMLLPPGQPTVTGRAGIEAWMNALPPLSTFELMLDRIEGAGDLAYVIGRYAMGFEGMPVDSGKYIEIRHRGDDGVWRLSADIFNSSLAAPPAE